MKTLLLLLSLSAVAVGQRTAKVYPLPCNVLDVESYVDSGGRATYECVHFVKPHKRKPPVKKGCLYGCDYTITCEGVCGKGPQVSSKDVLPCDGISCVGPVEMMPQKDDLCERWTGVGDNYVPAKCQEGQLSSFKVTMTVEPDKAGCESCSSADVDGRTCKPVKCPDKARLELLSAECTYTKERSECLCRTSFSEEKPHRCAQQLGHADPPYGACPTGVEEGPCYRVQIDKYAAPVEPTFHFEAFNIVPSTVTIVAQNSECSWQGFQYDPSTKTCSMRITFDVSSQVVCTPLVLNEQGKPEMTCSFKVIDKGVSEK